MGADVRIGGRDGRWLTNDAFDHITTAVVGPDRRARIVVTLHSTETAHNLQSPWGRVEPRRGGSATDVVPKKLGKCLALARARNRRRDRDGGGPHHWISWMRGRTTRRSAIAAARRRASWIIASARA